MTSIQDLEFIELDFGEEFYSFASAIFAAVHSFNVANDNALGIDFSQPRIRVLGAKKPLSDFVTQPRILRLTTMAAEFKLPQKVPATAGEAVVVKRYRAGTRQQPARLRRFAARNPGVVLKQKPVVPSDLAVEIFSASTGQHFLLKLVRVQAPVSEKVRFNSYGLVLEGSIPLF